MSKLNILITNDDGVLAPGIRFLIDIMKEFGNVTIVAPDKGQSGSSHAITFSEPLKLKSIKEEEGYKEFSCNGTPVDCVKLGENVAMDVKPDLLVSGVNHGSNASINVIYSGTMAAVIEGCIDEIPAIGFSIDTYSSEIDFEPARPYIRKIVQGIIKNGMPKDTCLNVNIPLMENINGMKVCRQAKASWKEGFDSRVNPRGESYHWLTGSFVVEDNGQDSDLHALSKGYISLVPVQVDLTAYKQLEHFKFLEEDSRN